MMTSIIILCYFSFFFYKLKAYQIGRFNTRGHIYVIKSSLLPSRSNKKHQSSALCLIPKQLRHGFDIHNCNRKTFQQCAPSNLEYSGFPKYDGNIVHSYGIANPFKVLRRVYEIGMPIMSWMLTNYITANLRPFSSIFNDVEFEKNRAIALKNAIVSSRSIAFIKSGQALSLRPDIIKNPYYISELSKLQDEVGSFDNSIAMNIIRSELGREPTEIFDFQPLQPVATASIGQVYRAQLRATGQYVAVKVQRPDAESTVPIDMFILRTIASIVMRVQNIRSDLVAVADLFGSQLFEELNYIQEAHNCKRFKVLYGNISGVQVPEVYLNLTTPRILVLEWINGMKGPWGAHDSETMLSIGLKCSVQQFLGAGFFHSDPHRGNLLKTPTNKLAYLDFGMMSEVEPYDRYAMIGAVIGIINNDFNFTVKNLRKLDFFPPSSDERKMVEALSGAVLSAMVESEGTSLNFSSLSKNIQAATINMPFRLPPFYTLLVRTLTILEGMALDVDPSFHLLRGAYPYIMRYILENPSPTMSNMLGQVLLTQNRRYVRWDMLEQLITIVVKNNIDGSSPFIQFQGGNVSVGSIIQLLDFILSSNGKIFRDALVNDIVDTIDSLGLTGLAVISLASFGVFPRPKTRPDRARISQFIIFLEAITKTKTNDCRVWAFQRLAGQLIQFLRDCTKPDGLSLYTSLFTKAAKLTPHILKGLASKYFKRSVRSIMITSKSSQSNDKKIKSR